MPEQNVSKITLSILSFFNKSISFIDKKVKFAQRKSKLTAKLFVQSLVLGCLSNPKMTLEDMRRFLKKRKVKITKQGLHERFTDQARELVKALFKKSLKQFKVQRSCMLDLFRFFSSVNLLDSTGLSLPEQLKSIYKGMGGTASEAGLKIQVLFEYINGQIKDIAITGARQNDQSFKNHLEMIEENGLYIQDLGYFNTESLKAIQNGNAYFVSRYLQQTKVFSTDHESIDLLKELRKAGPFYKKEILLGQKHKVKVRLIATRLPDIEIEKRLRRLNREAKKGTLSEETRELAKWSIFVTNVPESVLNDEQIQLVYSLRWQIELFFKLCKSEAGIDKINGKKHYRVICEIYAKLICISMLLYICFPVRWQNNLEISFVKAYREFHQRAQEFFIALSSRYRLSKFLKAFWEDLKDFALKERPRRKRKTTCQKIMSSSDQEILA